MSVTNGDDTGAPSPALQPTAGASESSNAFAELLAEASWVKQVSDPSLVLERLHNTFERVVFSGPPPEEDAESAEEEEEDEELDDDLQEAAKELLGEGSNGSREDDEGSNVFSNISDNEEEDLLEAEEGMDAEADDFRNWITADVRAPQDHADRLDEVRSTTAATAAARGVEYELQRVGLSDIDVIIERDQLPERYKLLALREQRFNLHSKMLDEHDRVGFEISIRRKAVWILRQMQKPGAIFHRNAHVAAILRDTYTMIERQPIVIAIEYALDKILNDGLEPAHLMLYHQTALSPLLSAILSDPSHMAQDELKPNPSYSYCLETGRRQRPFVSEKLVYNRFEATHATDLPKMDESNEKDKEPKWEMCASEEPRNARVKPCMLELGRVLITIVQLDVMCLRLEHMRQLQLRRLRALGSIASEQVSILESVVFESSVDGDTWNSYSTYLASSFAHKDSTEGGNVAQGMGWTKRLCHLGLERRFEEFSITGLQYHTNLHTQRPFYLPPHAPQADPYAWASSVGHSATRPMRGDEVLNLFTKVIVEQYTRLPMLRKRVFEAFCVDGEIVIEWLQGSSDRKFISVASLLNDTPSTYFDFLDQERNGFIKMRFYLNPSVVESIMDAKTLCGWKEKDPWSSERQVAWNAVARKLIEGCQPLVRVALEEAAQQAVQTTTCAMFADFCAEGPYEPVRLQLEAFDDAKRTWEVEWNAAESLATTPPESSRGSRRVCGVYRGEGGITSFTCIDEYGGVLGHFRWADNALETREGRLRQQQQLVGLHTFVEKYSPSVFGVAAVHMESLTMMRTLEEFVRERVHTDASGAHIAVVYVSPIVALVTTHSNAADASMPTADVVVRTSVAVARYLQNPLRELCQLFDSRRSVLKLPIAVHSRANSDKILEALEWEMTLWVNASGVDLEDNLRQPSPAAMLQFVCGFGARKAKRLTELLRLFPVRSRIAFENRVRDWFGEMVERNCVPALRLSSTSVEVDSKYHCLDGTLIPVEWYEIAERIASSALGFEGEDSGPFAVTALLLATEEERRNLLRSSFSLGDVTDRIRDARRSWERLGEGEILLVVSELLSNGRSHMQRPFRLMTNKMLFKLITGVAYLNRAESRTLLGTSAGSANTNPLVIQDGDVLQGTVSGMRSGAVLGIRVTTTRGVAAFISAEDIDDEEMKNQLLDWLQYVDAVKLARRNSSEMPLRQVCPPWLERQAYIQGIATNCSYEKGELRLRWCRPTTDAAQAIGGGDSRTAEAAAVPSGNRSVNSVMTEQIKRTALPNVMKIARHDLFKNISSEHALLLLRDKGIGECLLRPSGRSKREAIACVKIGSVSIANWPVREERVSSGAVVYRVQDSRTGRHYEFADADHFLDTFIKRAVERANSIRNHRKFVADARDVEERLSDDFRQERGWAYCFTEVYDASNRSQSFYTACYRVGFHGRTHRLKLHLDNSHIHIRILKKDNSVEWIACRNAEETSAVLKAYVETLVSTNSKRRPRED